MPIIQDISISSLLRVPSLRVRAMNGSHIFAKLVQATFLVAALSVPLTVSGNSLRESTADRSTVVVDALEAGGPKANLHAPGVFCAGVCSTTYKDEQDKCEQPPPFFSCAGPVNYKNYRNRYDVTCIFRGSQTHFVACAAWYSAGCCSTPSAAPACG